jgi:hypothetical protein
MYSSAQYLGHSIGLLRLAPLPVSRTREHAILEVNDLRLLHHRSCNLLELLVDWILVDVIVPVLVGVESKYEGVSYTILDGFSKLEL